MLRFLGNFNWIGFLSQNGFWAYILFSIRQKTLYFLFSGAIISFDL